ncbi:hypothetical protein BU24DRAFT_481891 [Aaosphaeria arxii CBS 175.79]|uniref:Uncharacterized protein n=1 Tax=Aaosphaeria arxii CBS 175.79 TaxID=1450172 RepID=A0A6A5XQ18_9PLEO|nr:uncharacterized protein BU24DRAFT_481891 [Aaosphaeria arxii CBS 175.79]KAF2014434.1 hypothetical protein BU24DRAFT_481891 [Aaosphaeria arxii CBS 175.79]
MPPPRPRKITAGEQVVSVFDGAITFRNLPHPTRNFNLEVTFSDHHPHLLRLREHEPPPHFHYLQVEYFQVIEGSLYVDVGPNRVLLTHNDDELPVPPWVRNRTIPGPLSNDQQVTKFLLSGPAPKGKESRMLDYIFYENYYRYMDEMVSTGQAIDFIQILCMFDAGGSCIMLPWWVPCGMLVSRALGVVVGRWIGAILGYQPYYREWTTDWDTAARRMRSSLWQRRFAG